MLKKRIMELVEQSLNIPVRDNTVEQHNTEISNLLFKGYRDNHKNELYIIDNEIYDTYEKEEIPNSINTTKLLIKDTTYNILDYEKENGLLILDKVVDNLCPYNDILFYEKTENNKDFILISLPYTYTNRTNINTLEIFTRVEFDIFVYNDLHKYKTNKYKQELQDLFSRDFVINKTNYGYIQIPLTVRQEEYNKTNHIIKATMLVRTYS